MKKKMPFFPFDLATISQEELADEIAHQQEKLHKVTQMADLHRSDGFTQGGFIDFETELTRKVSILVQEMERRKQP